MCFDGESPTLFRQTERTARKRHVCAECQMPILRGERYEETFGVWSHKPNTHRTCLFCVWLRDRVAASESEHGCHGIESAPPFGCLYEALGDGYDEGIGMVNLERYEELRA